MSDVTPESKQAPLSPAIADRDRVWCAALIPEAIEVTSRVAGRVVDGTALKSLIDLGIRIPGEGVASAPHPAVEAIREWLAAEDAWGKSCEGDDAAYERYKAAEAAILAIASNTNLTPVSTGLVDAIAAGAELRRIIDQSIVDVAAIVRMNDSPHVESMLLHLADELGRAEAQLVPEEGAPAQPDPRDAELRAKIEAYSKAGWLAELYPEGATPENIANELEDYRAMIGRAMEIISHVTGGQLSYATYKAEDVIAASDQYSAECRDRDVAEALAEAKEEFEAEIEKWQVRAEAAEARVKKLEAIADAGKSEAEGARYFTAMDRSQFAYVRVDLDGSYTTVNHAGLDVERSPDVDLIFDEASDGMRTELTREQALARLTQPAPPAADAAQASEGMARVVEGKALDGDMQWFARRGDLVFVRWGCAWKPWKDGEWNGHAFRRDCVVHARAHGIPLEGEGE